MRESTTDVASATGGAPEGSAALDSGAGFGLRDLGQRPSGMRRARRLAGPPQPRPSTPTRSAAPGQTPPRDRARPDRRPGRSRTRLSGLLPALALLLGALSLLAAAPAQAQTTVWSGTMTVGDGGTWKGFQATSAGQLSDDDFTYGGVTYTITSLRLSNSGGHLRLRLNKEIPSALYLTSGLVLHVGTSQFPLVDATLFSSEPIPSYKTASWDYSGLTWSVGGTVSLSLVAPSPSTVRLSVSRNPVREGSWVSVEACLRKGGRRAVPKGTLRIPVTLSHGTSETGDWGASLSGHTDGRAPIRTAESISISGSHQSSCGLVNIPTHRDSDPDDETFTVALNTANLPPGVQAGSPASVEVTIEDLAITTVSLSALQNPVNYANIPRSLTHAHGTAESVSVSSPNLVAEGSDLRVTATLALTLSSDVTIPLSLSNGTAEDGDYGSLSSITIPAGSLSATGTITTNHDTDTDDETFTVALDMANLPSHVGTGDPSSTAVTVTIKDDDTNSAPPGGGGPYAALITKMYEWRNDPRYVNDKAHTDRWDRALLAFGESVSDSSLTPMSATEAQGYADQGWVRWVEVAAALREIEGGSGQYAALIEKMYEWRNDPRYVNDKAHTDRWDRALLAFGESVSDSSLTPMSAAEAQGYADRGWTRWVEVAAALWEIQGGRPATDPVVTVAAGGAVTEGTAAGFTLTAAPAPAADLAVTVAVAQGGSVADASALGERTVTIPAGTASADFTVATVNDEADEEDGRIVATLAAGSGYTVGDAGRASVTVADDDDDNPGIVTKRAIAREGDDDAVVFTVRLDGPASHTVTVDYATADGAGVWASTGTATAGVDYTPTSGTLAFAAGETWKSVSVPILDDVIDEGTEYFLLRFSNPQGATLEAGRREVQGLIRNTDLVPGALLSRFGRATAEQVVTQVEERMAAPRRRGFRARFAGRELRSGQERDFALGLMSQFAQPMGMGPAGAAPMGMGSHAAGAGAFGVSTSGMTGMGGAMGMTGMSAAGGAMGMTGVGAADGAMGMGGMPGAMGGYGSAGGAHGGGMLGSMGMGGELFSNSEFELNRESRGGMLSVWSRSSRSYFSGLENALSLDGDVRTTMFGADYSRGALTVGLSVGRTLGMGGFRRDANGGQMTTSMTGFYPWVGYQVNDRVSVWGVTGYGTGALSLAPDGRSAMETGVSMAMSAVGTRGELIGARATGGFALAFKADALWVGAASDLVDGAMGRLNASDAGVTRVRTALEGSRGYTLVGGRLSLTPSVEVGLRRDGGDAETGAGMDVGGGLAFTDAVTGLSLDVRVRTLVVHQAEGFSERGMSLSFGWDPTPSSPLGLNARVAPSWGGQAMGGAEALWNNQMAYGMGSHQMYGAGGQLNADVGYGLPVGARLVGTPRVGLTTSQYGRDYRVGYGLGVLDRGDVRFELGVDAQRREMSMQGEASNGVMGRGTLGW